MKLRVFDAHVHLFDSEANTHSFLEHEDPSLKAIAGDYSSLPRIYLTNNYLNDSTSCEVEGIVWYEFLSDDPAREAKWSQRLADASRLRHSMVVRVDFLDPALEGTLAAYEALPNVVAVREHLGWDVGNALRRFAKRPNLLREQEWRKGLGALRRYGFKCGIELFSPQLSEFPEVARLYADVGFTLAVMGWPLDLSSTGYAQWRHDLRAVSRCENVCIEIAAIECLFGMDWRQEDVAPWILSAIELFGPARCMFGSHMPIAGLSVGFEHLYDVYQEIVAGFSTVERDALFRGTAAAWFKRG